MADVTQESVALSVLPLRDLSAENAQSHLALGFTEDLLTELLRLPNLEVFTGDSVAGAVPEGSLDLERARELGVSHVLRGTVRRDDSTVRVNVQLVELSDGRLSWAETFDAPVDDIFRVQDEIVGRLAGALALHFDDRQLARARRTPLGGLTTYECWLRGLECLRRGTLEADEEARAYFERAVELDPRYARAWAGLSLSYFNEWSCQVWHLFEENESAAFDNALRAVEIDDGDAVVHLVLGRIRVFRRDFEAGRRSLERAVALHPHHPEILAHLGLLWSNLGEPARALETSRRAQKLNPRHQPWYFLGEAVALYLLGKFEQALGVAMQAGTAFVDAPAVRAAAAGMLSDTDRARRELERFDREFRLKITFGREPEPGERMRWLEHVNPFRRDEDRQLLVEGLTRAGLEAPEPGMRTSSARPTANAPRLPVDGNVFRRDDGHWAVAFEGEGAQLGELKGFHDLAQLLARPDQEIHCLELRGMPAEEGPAAQLLDERARREIGARIEELETEVRDAEADHDLGRAERAREELELLRAELSKALGLGGRSRRMGDQAEKARTAVTWRIRSAIKKLAVAHPRLGRHLERAVKTGLFCVYSPEQPTDWRIG